jgi:hypothetical protein
VILAPRERRCRAGQPDTIEHFEDICRGRASVYGVAPPGTRDVRLRTRLGAALATRVRFFDGGYFVAEARTRAHQGRGWTRERLGSASVLAAADMLTIVRCGAPSRPSRR